MPRKPQSHPETSPYHMPGYNRPPVKREDELETIMAWMAQGIQHDMSSMEEFLDKKALANKARTWEGRMSGNEAFGCHCMHPDRP